MADKGAILIAGTGYQYGDTDFVEYSERLYAGIADELRTGTGPVALGTALVRAKQDYLATTPVLSGIHQKALAEATLYGLPMLALDLPERSAAGCPARRPAAPTPPWAPAPARCSACAPRTVTRRRRRPPLRHPALRPTPTAPG